jgi:hypothetical protein
VGESFGFCKINRSPAFSRSKACVKICTAAGTLLLSRNSEAAMFVDPTNTKN